MLLWSSVYRYLFEYMLSVLLEVYPQVELLDRINSVFNFLRDICFQQQLYHFTFPPASVSVPVSPLPPPASACHVLFFSSFLKMDVKSQLSGASVYICLVDSTCKADRSSSTPPFCSSAALAPPRLPSPGPSTCWHASGPAICMCSHVWGHLSQSHSWHIINRLRIPKVISHQTELVFVFFLEGGCRICPLAVFPSQ